MYDRPIARPQLPFAQAPWGFWASVGIVALVFAVQNFAASFIVLPFLVPLLHDLHDPLVLLSAKELQSNGLLLSLSAIATTPLCIVILLAFADMRPGWPLRKYLALQRPRLLSIIGWLLALVAFMYATEAVSHLVGHRSISDFQINAFRTAGFLPLLYVAIVVMAPLLEELIFRGFLLQGFRHSVVGVGWAVVISSAMWASLHIQYDFFDIFSIFLLGLLFCAARLRSGSLYVPIAMHMFMNLVATLQTAAYLRAPMPV
jgi:uncharacterized protein